MLSKLLKCNYSIKNKWSNTDFEFNHEKWQAILENIVGTLWYFIPMIPTFPQSRSIVYSFALNFISANSTAWYAFPLIYDTYTSNSGIQN